MPPPGHRPPVSPRDEIALPLLMIRAALRGFFARLRHHSPAAIPTLFGTTLIAAVLIALQLVVPPAAMVLVLLLGGLALGLVVGNVRDAVLVGFLMGYVAFFAGSTALGIWFAVSGASGSSPWDLFGGLFVGLVFGIVAGVWSAGAAGMIGVVRRRPHVGHVL